MTNLGAQLLQQIRNGSRWEGKDDFPSCKEWEEEVKKWLVFINDEGVFNGYLSRLRDNASQRDSAISEIAIAYFMSRKKGLQIVEWFPKGSNKKRGEFVIDMCRKQVWCEVKAPGWESDFVKEGSFSKRLKNPKHVIGECRSVDDTDKIKYTIEKSYIKIPNNKATLLIIADDFMIPLSERVYGNLVIDRSLFYKKCKPPHHDDREEGCFVTDRYKNLSGLATFNVEKQNGNCEIQYCFNLYRNPFAVNNLLLNF
jgi:hypothetical protein